MLSPALFLAGRAAQILRLPQITGFVLGGVLVGPFGLNLLRAEGLPSLAVVDHACLAIIAFAAGAELQWAELRRIRGQVLYITLGVSAASYGFVYLALVALAPGLALLHARPWRHVQTIASMAATLAIARSPASMIAVLKETEGRGPYCSLVMAVVVTKDVLVFICFSLNVELSALVMRNAGEGFRLTSLAGPLGSLFRSIALGVAAGALMGRVISLPARPFNWALRRLPQTAGGRVKGLARTAAVVGMAVAVFWAAESFAAEPLLACVLAGVVATNRKGEALAGSVHEELAGALGAVMGPVNLAFFSLAGASLVLGSLVGTLGAAAVVWAMRVGAVYCGSWLGAWLGGTPPEHRRRVWYGMITQAGVAMGLAKAVAARFPDWGPEFVTLMMTVILLNLVTGPPLFRTAIIAVGEARALQLPSLAGDVFEADGPFQRTASMPKAVSKPQLATDGERGVNGGGADAAANGIVTKPSGGGGERDGGRGTAASPRMQSLERRADADAFA
ncbi:hypothetical protein WJX81_000261 [Elliptochloris bilobata]|uniref:Cation/H+ exchanger transmembrane domain-containing protein n=1 Tax=Elliptochloris bilobata TaxID=381761 RepID=A0AAW1S873_9CHLO